METPNHLNKYNLADNEIMIKRRKLLFIPQTLKLWELQECLMKGKGYTKEEAQHELRIYNEIIPYVYSLVKVFTEHNEAVLKVRSFDVDKAQSIIKLFERAFNLKTPYGKNGESYKTEDGKEFVKFVLVKKLW